MHPIQVHFGKGQLLFSQRQFAKAYLEFEKCTLLMPELSEAWENMAVCMVNDGKSVQTLQQQLVPKAPKAIQANLRQKISTLLPTVTSKSPKYLTLLQQFKLSEAVVAFTETWSNKSVTDDQAIQFLRGLFIAHEHLAKKQGQMHLPQLLNAWKDMPAIQHCLDTTSQRVQALIIRTKSYPESLQPNDIELLETLGLVHYTYTNYQQAAFCFQTLYALSLDMEKKEEYKSHLSTCYSLNAQYKEALEIDEDNITAWERYDPTNPKAFRAQSLRLVRSAQRINRHCLPYWSPNAITYQDTEVTIAKLKNASVCGHDPMVFDEDFVYAGNRGTFRLAEPNTDTERQIAKGIVVFATNPNNHYHLLVEFCAKLLAAEQHLPVDIPVYIPTSNRERVQEMVKRLGILRTIQDFSVHENIRFKDLYVIDVAKPGHFSTSPPNLWDCYLSQGESLKRIAKRFVHPNDAVKAAPNLLIYAKRFGGARSFLDPNDILEPFLSKWATEHNLELVVFEGTGTLTEQIHLFQRCRLLFGLHGAGFTNLLFTPPECTMVEIPIHGNCNPLFQEMSALMSRKHIVCEVSCEYQGTLEISETVLQQVEQDLNQAIS